tara:strand:+ start:46 stop:1125 length:1080 start_codon:yes stop_codon:yes gene_type:complete
VYAVSEIKEIEWELTTKCNAACPQCPRNNYGGETISSLPITSITLEQVKNIIPWNDMTSLEFVYFCGTYGDPIACPDLLGIASWIKENTNCTVALHTNGGLQSPAYWKQLSKVTDWCAFGIDGLEDTNHLYRRNVKWNKLINNVKAYIDAGGEAKWDFIVFKHNQHQVDEARELANSLGFAEFNYKKTMRFLDKKHNFLDKQPVLDNKGKLEYYLEMPTVDKYVNTVAEAFQQIKSQYGSFNAYANITPIRCFNMHKGKLYIGADGYVFPCGWLADRLYGKDAEQHPDHIKLKQLWEQLGGSHKANIYHTPLKEVVEQTWFQQLERSWTNKDRLERCGAQCGDDVNHIGDQNANVEYVT